MTEQQARSATWMTDDPAQLRAAISAAAQSVRLYREDPNARGGGAYFDYLAIPDEDAPVAVQREARWRHMLFARAMGELLCMVRDRVPAALVDEVLSTAERDPQLLGRLRYEHYK